MRFERARIQPRLSVTFLGSSSVLSLRATFGPVRLASFLALWSPVQTKQVQNAVVSTTDSLVSVKSNALRRFAVDCLVSSMRVSVGVFGPITRLPLEFP